MKKPNYKLVKKSLKIYYFCECMKSSGAIDAMFHQSISTLEVFLSHSNSDTSLLISVSEIVVS